MEKEPKVDDDYFIPFLRWLLNERLYEAKDIIYVVEKPWKYKDEYHLFLKEY